MWGGSRVFTLHKKRILYANNLSGGGVFDFHMGPTTKFQKNKMAEGKLPPTSLLRLHKKTGGSFEIDCIIEVLQLIKSTWKYYGRNMELGRYSGICAYIKIQKR